MVVLSICTNFVSESKIVTSFMEYNFNDIENKWQKYWVENKTYKVVEDASKQKFYVLNMFPYPSGAGLHVGHPLGYIASDIYARYKRLCGFNVLNPMGYDAYGLPAEQYAIQTGQHPEKTTTDNIARYRKQLDKIGFSFDWDREIRTCDPSYYHWTQWAFQKMFNSYYDEELQKAQPIEKLISKLEQNPEWNALSDKKKEQDLMNYRIAYIGETMVNWCAELGTVLANDEVVDGVSVRGGYPVVQKKMRQWCLRVSAYAPRLLDGLDKIEWSEALKETQRNWIGRSEGAEVRFKVKDSETEFTVFTTRADTMFGVTFMVLAPESEYVSMVTTAERESEVKAYLEATAKRTERDRIANKKVSGVFTGSYAINPVTGNAIPIWVSDYVLSGYGTGAIMAVPAHDSRDYAFAKHFDLSIIPLIEGADVSEESFDAKEGIVMNSGFLNGLQVKDAIKKMKEYIEETGLGRVKVNYRLRDAIFSRQRYWGEPFPVYYVDGMPKMIPEDCLPVELPEIEEYKPTENGEPPLGRAKTWAWDTEKRQIVDNALIDNKTIFPIDLFTMPGFAGSSAYYLRYMDAHNDTALVDKETDEYWRSVDLYVGGIEHATGHLIYSRFWNKFLYDYGYSCDDEPFHKLINQGMIQGRSNFVYRIQNTNTFVSSGLKDKYATTPIHVDVNIVDGDVLDIEAFKSWRSEYADAEFVLENEKYICGWAIEKMSKSMFNVVNPDMIVEKYGADTLRLYEMFLGPVEQSKPWNTNGIDGCHRFLKKFWGLFYDREGNYLPNEEQPTQEQLKSLHRLIKKITEDIENFSYNTCVSAFMICVNELTQLKCKNKDLLKDMVICIAPFAPHIAEELWHALGNTNTVCDAPWPKYDEKYLVENDMQLTISFNGKARFQKQFPADADNDSIQKAVLEDEQTQKYIDGMEILKVIIVPKKIVNIVLKK